MSIERDVNNRGFDVATEQITTGQSADGAIPVNLDFKNARQTVPTNNIQSTPPANQPGSHYPQSNPFPLDNGMGTDDADEGDERQAISDPTLRGSIPDPGCGDKGQTVDWKGVAPYRYPEFPMQSSKTGMKEKDAPILGG